MSAPEGLAAHEALAEMSDVLSARLAEAECIQVLSESGDKSLQVMQEADGQKFVTRTFSKKAIQEIEGRKYNDLTFLQAWDSMHTIFNDVDIDIVPSFLFKSDDEERPYIVISEYLEDTVPMRSLSLDTKKALADKLAQLLAAKNGYMPMPEVIAVDMLQATSTDETDARILMTDTDPLIMRKPASVPAIDDFNAANIGGMKSLAIFWCAPEDRAAFLAACATSLRSHLGDEISTKYPKTFTSFTGLLEARHLN